MLTVGAIFQLLHRNVAVGLGNNQVRFRGGHRFEIDIRRADKPNRAVIEINAGQLCAGA